MSHAPMKNWLFTLDFRLINQPVTTFFSLFRYRQHSLASMEAYDPRRNVWIKLADMGTPCSGLGACAVFGLLYTVCCISYHSITETDQI